MPHSVAGPAATSSSPWRMPQSVARPADSDNSKGLRMPPLRPIHVPSFLSPESTSSGTSSTAGDLAETSRGSSGLRLEV